MRNDKYADLAALHARYDGPLPPLIAAEKAMDAFELNWTLRWQLQAVRRGRRQGRTSELAQLCESIKQIHFHLFKPLV